MKRSKTKEGFSTTHVDISKVRQGYHSYPENFNHLRGAAKPTLMSMILCRFSRLTNVSAKKLSHLKAAVSLHLAWYNFCRVHGTLRVTPAMEANLTDHVWGILELLATALAN